MTNFLFAYRAPLDFGQGDPAAAEAWGTFFAGLGPHIEDAGNPIFSRGAVGQTGPDTIISGYSVINADSLDEALALAGDCPLIADRGGVEVGEITAMLTPELLRNGASSAAV